MVVFLAVAAYANSLGNGFAFDDGAIIVENDRVREGRVAELIGSPYWPEAREGTGLYRPLSVASYAVEWELWDGRPLGFHAVNVAAHAAVSLLVLVLAAGMVPLLWATVGAAVFAIHPVHTEAVANVVGRAELYAALFFLGACWLYLRGKDWSTFGRALRLVGVGACYFLALGSKEIAVTLPGILLLLDAARAAEPGDWIRRVRDEIPVYLLLGVALAAYLGARYLALGGLLGEVTAGPLRDLTPGQRVLTSLSLWGEYLRLLVFPLDLVADYGPAVFLPSTGFNVQVAMGLLVLGLLGVVAAKTWRDDRPIALGILWFAAAVLPVSHLFFPAGTVFAERTLYLPSVGMAFVVGGLSHRIAEEATSSGTRRAAAAVGLVAALALFARTVDRNPSWFDTHTVMQTLAEEHPESHRALAYRAEGLARVGELREAERHYEAALEMAPHRHGLVVRVGVFQRERGNLDRAERLFRRVLEATSGHRTARFELANTLILQGRPREAIPVALGGLGGTPFDGRLWGAVSEAHAAMEDLPGALRARRTAVTLDPSGRRSWTRLGDLLERSGATGEAARARARASTLDPAGPR